MLATQVRPSQHPAARRCAARRRVGLVFAAMGLAMIPWVFHLSVSLTAAAVDAHWSLAWVGLDSGEAVALFTTGLLLVRGDNRCALTAATTSALLLIDAWFDTTSATSGSELAVAIVMAVCLEIPIALACAALALRLIRRPFHPVSSSAGN